MLVRAEAGLAITARTVAAQRVRVRCAEMLRKENGDDSSSVRHVSQRGICAERLVRGAHVVVNGGRPEARDAAGRRVG